MRETAKAAARISPATTRPAIAGAMPLSTGLRWRQMNCSPIDAPAAAAMASGRGAGRVPAVPPAALIATTATRARPMPAAAVPVSCSPSRPTPAATGTAAEITAVSGDRMLIGPTARLA